MALPGERRDRYPGLATVGGPGPRLRDELPTEPPRRGPVHDGTRPTGGPSTLEDTRPLPRRDAGRARAPGLPPSGRAVEDRLEGPGGGGSRSASPVLRPSALRRTLPEDPSPSPREARCRRCAQLRHDPQPGTGSGSRHLRDLAQGRRLVRQERCGAPSTLGPTPLDTASPRRLPAWERGELLRGSRARAPAPVPPRGRRGRPVDPRGGLVRARSVPCMDPRGEGPSVPSRGSVPPGRGIPSRAAASKGTGSGSRRATRRPDPAGPRADRERPSAAGPSGMRPIDGLTAEGSRARPTSRSW